MCCNSSLFDTACRRAADPLIHIAVTLKGVDGVLCFMKAETHAAEVFKICRLKARCEQGTLQDSFGMDIAENDKIGLPAGAYCFAPAGYRGTSPPADTV